MRPAFVSATDGVFLQLAGLALLGLLGVVLLFRPARCRALHRAEWVRGITGLPLCTICRTERLARASWLDAEIEALTRAPRPAPKRSAPILRLVHPLPQALGDGPAALADQMRVEATNRRDRG